MSRARAVAVLLFAATAAAWVVASVGNVLAWRDDVPQAFPPVFPLFLAVAILTPAAVGLFVALRRPGNRVAWILLAGPLSVAIVMAGDGLARYWGPTSAAGAWAAWLSYLWPVLFAWPVALAFRFPDGRLPSRRWWVSWWIAVASFGGALALLGLVDTIERDDGTEIPNPFRSTSTGRSASRPSGSAGPASSRRSCSRCWRCGRGTGRAGRRSAARCCGWRTARSSCPCGSAAAR